MIEGESGVIKFGKKETTLLGWRIAMLIITISGGIGIYNSNTHLHNIRQDLKDIQQDTINLRNEIGRNRLADAREVGELRGRVVGIEGVIVVHRDRLRTIEEDLRTVWTEIRTIIKGGQK